MKKRNWLNDSNIILSGCSTGIGKQLALTLCRDYNCKIIGLARNEEKLKALKNEIGENFDFIAIDISQKQNWTIIYNRLVEINFCPDILINNAGIIHRLAKFRALTDEILDNTLNTNFLSVVNSIKILLPLLDKSSKKAIINVSSASAYLACPGVSLYTATKSATLAFSDVLREELSGEGYYIGVVLPGPVQTELYSQRDKSKNESIVKDKFISGYGITAQQASKKIIQKIKRRKKHITIGFSAHLMNGFHRLFPTFSVTIIGKLFRIVPLETYKEMFKEEKKPKSNN